MRNPSKRPVGFWAFALVATLTAAGFPAGGCTDQQDLCKAFCYKAAECLNCGSTANLDRCQDTCVNLSIDEQKALGDCSDDCLIMRTCPAFTQHPDLNPCRP